MVAARVECPWKSGERRSLILHNMKRARAAAILTRSFTVDLSDHRLSLYPICSASINDRLDHDSAERPQFAPKKLAGALLIAIKIADFRKIFSHCRNQKKNTIFLFCPHLLTLLCAYNERSTGFISIWWDMREKKKNIQIIFFVRICETEKISPAAGS